MLARTANISFPRSGHHALKAVLADYFGEEFRYHDVYLGDPENRLDVNPATNYTKDHDLDLLGAILPDVRYLIQIRNPLLAVQSWINFDARTAAIDRNRTFEEWQAVTIERLDFWTLWTKKWVLSEIRPRLVVPYEELIASPFSVCESVVQFMTTGHPDPDRLARSLAKFPIAPRRPPKHSRIDYV